MALRAVYWERLYKTKVYHIDIVNKKSYNVLKHDNGRYCWMAIHLITFFFTCRHWVGVPISVLDQSKNVRSVSIQKKTYKIPSKQLKFQELLPPPPTPTPTALTSYQQQCDYASLTWGGVRGKGVGDLVIQLI